jgi:hypothetical protein
MTTKTQLHSINVRDSTGQWVPRRNPVVDNLFNETTFYPAFTKDVLEAKREIIIYSPFVSKYRSDTFNQLLYKLSKTNVDIFIFTRPIDEYDREQRNQVQKVLNHYEEMGAYIFYLNGSIHEKVAIIDREILWEGSLNILSQRTSREMMRRIDDEDSALQVIRYLGLTRMLAEGYRQKYEKLYRSLMEGTQRKHLFSWRVVVAGFLATVAVWWIFILLSGIIPLKLIMGLISVLQALPPR